jgi:hypothetical protein
MRLRQGIVLAGVSLFIAATVACSSTDHPPATTTPGGGSTSGSVGGGGGDGGDAGKDASTIPTEAGGNDGASTADSGVCTALVDNGPLVERVYIVADPPVMTGGAIVDGIYDVTDSKVYVGPTGPTGTTDFSLQVSAQITGGVIEASAVLSGAGLVNKPVTRGTLATNGKSLTATQTCPTAGAPVISEYTATATTLTISSTPSPGLSPTATKEVTVYTKR